MANAFVQNKEFLAFGVFFLIGLLQKGGATDFIVGGSKGWSVPTDSNAQSYNQWAEANRFQVGDSLVFKYPADQDSVFQVSQNDYINCSTQSPIRTYSDGHTLFKLDQSGPYYFISGNKQNCLKNEKLVLVVLANRTNSTTNQTSPLPPPPSAAPEMAPPPSNQTEITPSPAPQSDQAGMASPPPSESTETNPSPAPAGEESPAPPPQTAVINPTAPSVSGTPPPNAAALIIPSCLGSIGALVAALSLAF